MVSPQVVDVPNPSKTAGALDWSALKNSDAWVALITFLYLDFLDATGGLQHFGMLSQS